jgi:hypothetical protein
MDTIEFIAEIGSDNVIRPPAGTTLPAGTVRVSVKMQPAQADAVPDVPLEEDWLYRLVEDARRDPPDLPTDLAAQHDHYLYGVPKS